MSPAIKKLGILVGIVLFAQAAVAGEFTQTLTPENLRASGLGKLTPKELAALEALIEDYKSGAPASPAAPSEASPGATAAAQEPGSKASEKKRMPEWVGALITLKRAESNPKKQEALESRIAGDFEGWSGRTNFKLENGQVWTQVNKDDTYVYTPALKSPKVKIVPAAFGTFMMEVEGVSQLVRIRPIRLE